MTRRQGYDRIGRTVTLEAAQRSCLTKKKYDSKNKARDAAAHYRDLPDSRPQRPYRCGICSGWHLTSIKPAPPAKQQRA